MQDRGPLAGIRFRAGPFSFVSFPTAHRTQADRDVNPLDPRAATIRALTITMGVGMLNPYNSPFSSPYRSLYRNPIHS